MRFLVVLCLLSAAVALPTPEQLHTNLPALPAPPELKSEEKDKSSDEKVERDIPQSQHEEELEKSDESKNPSESEEKPKVEKDEDKKKIDDDIAIVLKDSEEAKDSKDKSKESKESKEPWETRPEEPKEEKKDSKSEESKEKDADDYPVIIEVISGPKGSFYDWLSKWFPTKLPWPFGRSAWRNGDLQDQPIYIVSESDFDLD